LLVGSPRWLRTQHAEAQSAVQGSNTGQEDALSLHEHDSGGCQLVS
jgi:hypothetical protein